MTEDGRLRAEFSVQRSEFRKSEKAKDWGRKMNIANNLAFVVFPYLMLTVFVVGHIYRYVTDSFGWNARSSEFLEKKQLFYGATIFHWGILLTLLGHAGGLLIPQKVFDVAGINGDTHTMIAYYTGWVAGGAAFAGAVLLLLRRITRRRIQATTRVNDYVTLLGLILVTGLGFYNVIFGHFYILDTVAPWIRSIVTFSPEPELMIGVPLSYKFHILSALALLGFSPFSRLVHIWSAPFTYVLRGRIVFRRSVTEF
ncbi:MAG: respiratory nitrate reductase subunit gamma [Desulfobacterales bacterium]|jgi:nitrate reductase gamma subunit